ncbi:39S ribosomal protein S30, mitochondrial [Latimeria chalumnae]|uniref:39S ribosomal protein S30, mitochondrial n=1 Tax=Latimeria chalumnae TaxID=7897 RepID=UPI0006D8EDC6|nr:PREDICTED: 28S ribosomal protein S30, mitochondrial [Latimeria chalumnae]|eukprot:XP_006014005.2 PREDICTED: 28S ribosomal protein S30, mitochondrial [Latimeria chalumnae]
MAAQGRLHFFASSLQRVLHTDTLAAATAPVTARALSLYPPIVASLTAKSKAARRRREEVYRERVHAAGSVQETLRLLTKLQRMKYVVYPQTLALNADRWYQHFTKTAFLPKLPEKLPSFPLTTQQEDAGGASSSNQASWTDGVDLASLRSLVCNAVLQENFYLKKKKAFLYREHELLVAPFLSNLVTILTSVLAEHNPLLKRSSLDFKPEVNFYWLRGEKTVTRGRRKRRVDPIRFQIDDKPHSQIRILKQLPEFVPLEYSAPTEVPVINFEPNKLPLFQRQYDNNIFIGSKVADPYCYGHTQFHFVPDKLKRNRFEKANLTDQIEVCLRANAIASLFAWTGAQAMYQGFWSHADVTRPFVSQAVITDGKYYSFFCYQLNTLALTVQTDVNNPRKNICWGTESMKLYEAVEDDKVEGFNDEVLELLVRFLLNAPNL